MKSHRFPMVFLGFSYGFPHGFSSMFRKKYPRLHPRLAATGGAGILSSLSQAQHHHTDLRRAVKTGWENWKIRQFPETPGVDDDFLVMLGDILNKKKGETREY